MTDDTYLEQIDWERGGPELYRVRHEVFVREQQVPEELEQDDRDPLSHHVLARDAQGRPVATGRLLPDGHIGRLAVLAPWRGRGLGRRVLLKLLLLARERNMERVELNAQFQALDFYRELGFEPFGEEFMEAGIRHRAMALSLAGPVPLTGYLRVRDALLTLGQELWRSLEFYLPVVEPRLLDDQDWLALLGRRLNARPRLQVRLLLPRAEQWRRDCPRLGQLLQTLPTRLELRTLSPEAIQERAQGLQGFAIFDKGPLLHLSDPCRLVGQLHLRGGPLTRDLLGLFAESWEKGGEDMELRRLGI